MRKRKILYVHPHGDFFRSFHDSIVSKRGQYEGLFCSGLSQSNLEVTDLEKVLEVLRKQGDGLDLIATNEHTNERLELAYNVKRLGLTEAMILLILHVDDLTVERHIDFYGADFAIKLQKREWRQQKEVGVALDNMLSKRTGGYDYNPSLYEDVNGVLIPKI